MRCTFPTFLSLCMCAQDELAAATNANNYIQAATVQLMNTHLRIETPHPTSPRPTSHMPESPVVSPFVTPKPLVTATSTTTASADTNSLSEALQDSPPDALMWEWGGEEDGGDGKTSAFTHKTGKKQRNKRSRRKKKKAGGRKNSAKKRIMWRLLQQELRKVRVCV